MVNAEAELTVHLTPMRRRHLRQVLRIERQVYPRPWSLGLFLSELSMRGTRLYLVARVGADVVGYAGDHAHRR
jgi:ribosomal-protein-alanine N-acetyltransferase